MEFSYDDKDHDVIAVLQRNSIRIVFVCAPAAALDGKTFDVLYWRGDELTIAISEKFLTEDVSKAVEHKIQSMVDNPIEDFDYRSYANEYMSARLMRIMGEAINNVVDPDIYNVDVVLERLLDNS